MLCRDRSIFVCNDLAMIAFSNKGRETWILVVLPKVRLALPYSLELNVFYGSYETLSPHMSPAIHHLHQQGQNHQDAPYALFGIATLTGS